jgi:hypothetical protein
MKCNLVARICLYTLWLSAIGTGIAMVLDYENASGAVGPTPQRWVSGTSIPLDPTRDTLIMFAHPRCPCTRASLDELNRLLAQSAGHIAAHVLFFKPPDSPADWTHTILWKNAAAIPGVAVQEDVNDAIARKFGAETSGYVLLYGPRGQLLFRGGITGARGHAGDNIGESSVIALAQEKSPAVAQTPVYGCSLFSETNSLSTVAQ